MARRITKIGTPEALDVVVTRLGKESNSDAKRHLLRAISEGLAGRRKAPMPKHWSGFSGYLINNTDAEVAMLATALALKFGDPAALAKLRGLLGDKKQQIAQRKQALDALLAVRDPKLATTLQSLIDDQPLRIPVVACVAEELGELEAVG